MSWLERLKQAAYESPEGDRLAFDYENVSQEVEKKTTAFNFPDADGTYIQDSGRTGRRYPMRVFFWGEDCDLAAAAFIEILLQPGVGTLEHPLYGNKTVVPFGTIKRRDDLKTASNQAVIEVAFWETINIIYPSAQGDPSSAVISAVDEYNDAAAAELDGALDLSTPTLAAQFKNKYETVLAVATTTLKKIADTQADVAAQFNAVNDSINNGIDILIGDPLTLAFQTTILIQAPSRAVTNISARLSAYSNLLDGILAGGVEAPGYNAAPSNAFHGSDLFASTYVTGAILSSVNTQFTTKRAALEAAEQILDMMDGVTDWRDANYGSLDQIDTGGAYQQLQEAVAITAGFLVEISFSLREEHTFTLQSDRTYIDLCAELYGATDDVYDEFIRTNNLSGSEHIEIKKGREIVYYI